MIKFQQKNLNEWQVWTKAREPDIKEIKALDSNPALATGWCDWISFLTSAVKRIVRLPKQFKE